MKSPPWSVFGIVGLFYAVGLGGLRSARRSTVGGLWATVTGTLTACEWVRTAGSGDDGPAYRVKVANTYAVQHQAHVNDQLTFGYGGDASYAAQGQIYDRLHAANGVTVRYDQADPATAALSFGVHRSIRFVLVLATMWLAFINGFAVLIWIGGCPDEVLLRRLVTP